MGMGHIRSHVTQLIQIDVYHVNENLLILIELFALIKIQVTVEIIWPSAWQVSLSSIWLHRALIGYSDVGDNFMLMAIFNCWCRQISFTRHQIQLRQAIRRNHMSHVPSIILKLSVTEQVWSQRRQRRYSAAVYLNRGFISKLY